MIHLIPDGNRHRRNRSRRQWFRQIGSGALACGLPAWSQAVAADSQPPAGATAKHCIYIFLCGGPSQLDLWDLKPDAPSEIRGPFQPIHTNVPGIEIGELLPFTARHADKFALVRSMFHDSTVHDIGIMYTLLGTMTPASKRAFPPSRDDHPGCGAILHRLLGGVDELPAWVTVPRPFTTGARFYKGQSAGFLGSSYDPFLLDEPKRDSLADKRFELEALAPRTGLDEHRLAVRRGLLERLDGMPTAANGGRQLQQYYEKAFAMLSTASAKKAFDLRLEPAKLRDRYGRNEYGQSFLLARRLVEAGVRMVNVFWTYYGPDGCQFNLWDNHGSESKVCGGASKGVDMLTHDYCCPSFDLAFSALLEDLAARGLLDETLVVVVGEFGRTPKINKNAGRDHWSGCYSTVLAGGGVRGGQVYGESDKLAAYVKHHPVSPDDLGATICRAFGFDADTMILDNLNRPIRISKGSPVHSLFT